MRKIFFLFFLVAFTVSAQKIDKKAVYNYSDDVEFSIKYIYKSRTVNRGNQAVNVLKISQKGGRYFQIGFNFKNKSSEPQVINFEEFYILDEGKNLHEPDVVAMNFKVQVGNMFEQELRPGASRNILVAFKDPIPKKELIKNLIINGEVFNLQYVD